MVKDIIKQLGGTVEVANMLSGVTPPAVSQWISKNAIPPLRAIQLEKLTDGEVKAVDIMDMGSNPNDE